MIISVRNRHCLSLMGKPLMCVIFIHSCVFTVHYSCQTMLLFTSKYHFNICTLFISMANLPYYCYFPVICWHACVCGFYTFPAFSNPINAETPNAHDDNVNMFTSGNLITILLRRTLQINLVNSIFANLNLICCSWRFCRFGMSIFCVRSMIDRIKIKLAPDAQRGCSTINDWNWKIQVKFSKALQKHNPWNDFELFMNYAGYYDKYYYFDESPIWKRKIEHVKWVLD